MYTVVFDGVEIRCDSADEVFELAGRLRGSSNGAGAPRNGAVEPKNGTSDAIPNSRWTSTRFQNFMALLNERQTRMLRELTTNPDGIPDVTLRQLLGVSTNQAFGPLLTWLSKRGKAVGVSLQDIVISQKAMLSSGEQMMEFKAAPAFIEIAARAGGIK